MTLILGTFLLLLSMLIVLGVAYAPSFALGRRTRANLRLSLHGETGRSPSRAQGAGPFAALVLPANRAWIERSFIRAGRPPAWPVSRVIIMKPVAALLAPVLPLMMFLTTGNGWSMVLTIVAFMVGYFVPDLLLHSRGTERQTTIGLELPDTLDQMLIAVEAGLGFDSAVARAATNGKGPLADELARTLQDMRVGLPRRDAYEALAGRTTSTDVHTFIRSVIQADAYGIAISSVLRVQAKEMRLKRRHRAEEKAMKIPVKVLFPLMVFILPVLFITVLGPTVIGFVGGGR